MVVKFAAKEIDCTKLIMGAEAEGILQSNGTARSGSSSRMKEAEFQAWKSRKEADASEKKAEEARKRAEDIAAGSVQMNGRELFLHEPWVFDNERY